MILTFKCKETEKIFYLQKTRKFAIDIQQAALRKLKMINNAISIADLRIPPANRLEKLRGDRKDQWSIRINNQWRICFLWKGGHAIEVEITDYH